LIGHQLKGLEDRLYGKLIADPGTVMSILEKHNETMNELAEKLFDKDIGHPLYKEWDKQELQLLEEIEPGNP
jgi:hypothetical protein